MRTFLRVCACGVLMLLLCKDFQESDEVKEIVLDQEKQRAGAGARPRERDRNENSCRKHNGIILLFGLRNEFGNYYTK